MRNARRPRDDGSGGDVRRVPRSHVAPPLTRSTWHAGWWDGARRVDSPNFGPRPTGARVCLAVIHSISLPPGHFGGNAIERLFTNTLDWNEHPYYEGIRGLAVSAHFVIRRGGQTLQFVSCDCRAWHAGESSWRGRGNCNDYSVGIELEGLEGGSFDSAQYRALVRVLRALATRYRLTGVAGHEHVAPGRKRDPGPGFAWPRLARQLRWPARFFPPRGTAPE